MNTRPQAQINRYCRAGAAAAAGTCISATMALVDRAKAAARTTAMRAKRENRVPMARFTSSPRRAPRYCPTSTVPPVDRPIIKLVTACMTWLPVDTAAMPAWSANCPTTIRSTAPYRNCSREAPRKGMAKRLNARLTFPSVRESWDMAVHSFLFRTRTV